MNQLKLSQVVDTLKDLPTLPAIVMELLNTLDREDLDIPLLAKKVTQDLALTAKTLRYANSPYYSTLVKVTTIQQAIALLGLDTVRQMVLSVSLSGCFPENNCKGFDHKAFWRHSNAVAFASKLIARRIGLNEDVAFIAGLLHDIGILALVSLFPQQYEEVLRYREETMSSQFEAERKILGLDHAAIGEALATEWNFSDVMKNAIAGHHLPEQPGIGFLATIVHVADGIAHMLGVSTTPESKSISISVVSWASLNLDQASVDTLLEEVRIKFKKLDQMDL
ncbi:MAG: HDOD domain-containing protein [Undibacterium sp.]|nr:HDOD domain-containing protein [Undibacterium sp.]